MQCHSQLWSSRQITSDNRLILIVDDCTPMSILDTSIHINTLTIAGNKYFIFTRDTWILTYLALDTANDNVVRCKQLRIHNSRLWYVQFTHLHLKPIVDVHRNSLTRRRSRIRVNALSRQSLLDCQELKALRLDEDNVGQARRTSCTSIQERRSWDKSAAQWNMHPRRRRRTRPNSKLQEPQLFPESTQPPYVVPRMLQELDWIWIWVECASCCWPPGDALTLALGPCKIRDMNHCTRPRIAQCKVATVWPTNDWSRTLQPYLSNSLVEDNRETSRCSLTFAKHQCVNKKQPNTRSLSSFINWLSTKLVRWLGA